ncbi:MAG: hypothetical protein L6R38_005402 [Xanthoria sp. 2 TBL-2021]|nr:MAG: hypothetical protein L6R38_005402 [Xanthoria sp. 2 TBL-2021]
MLKRKQPPNDQPTAPHFKLVKRLPQRSSQPFRFGNLPQTIRDRIYRLCLITEHPTSIVVDETSGWDGEELDTGQIYNSEELVRLTTAIHRQEHLNSNFTAALLQINSTIHEEAAPIIYGLNTFSFMGRNRWIDLIYFEWRLTGISRQSIRTVVIHFLEIKRGYNSELNRASTEGLKSLEKFSVLASLTLVVYEDILTSDLKHLRQIRDSVPGSCRIAIDVRKASRYHKDGGWDHRPVRISSHAVRKMQQWGWAMKGEWELVDQRHRLRHEEDWFEWLDQNHRRGVRFGYLEEPHGIYELCVFLW